MEINTTIEYYNNLNLNRIVSLLPIDSKSIKKAFKLKTLNNRKGILNKIIHRVENQNHFLISLLRNDNPYNFENEISKGIIDAIDKYYDLYLFINEQKEFFYCLIEEDNFPKNQVSRRLIKFEKIKPFNYKLFFFNRKKIHE